jgi:hypothetical protein
VIWAKHKFRYFKYPNDNGFPFDEATPYRLLYHRNSLLVYGDILRSTVVIDTVTLNNPSGFRSAFISSFTTSGDLKWIKCAGGPQGEPGGFNSCSTDKLGDIFITGLFEHKGIFGNDTLIQPGLNEDAFLAKYDVNGNYYWATNLKCSVFADGWVVAADSGGGVYFAGNFDGTAYFGNNQITSKYVGSTQFLAKYSSNGNNIGVVQYGVGGIYGLALDNAHNICFTGAFLDTLTLGRQTYYSHGDYDFFAAKSSPIINSIETKSQQDDKLLIYANPTTGICNIDIPESFQNEKELNLYIYDTAGKLIQKVPVILGEDKITFDIRAQAKGVYPVILTNGTKNFSGKIIFSN